MRRRDEDARARPTNSVDDAVPLGGHTIRLEVNFESGIVILTLGPKPCEDIACLCQAVASDHRIEANLRCVVLIVDGSSPQPPSADGQDGNEGGGRGEGVVGGARRDSVRASERFDEVGAVRLGALRATHGDARHGCAMLAMWPRRLSF